MTEDRDLRPDHEMEGSVGTWLTDSDLSTDEANAGLDRLLDEFPVTPQARRRFLGRWLDRDEGAGRRATEHDHPPDTNRRTTLMFSATGIIAALAILALGVSVVTNDPATPNAGSTGQSVSVDGAGEFDTIQAAVDAAAEGDTITIAPGVYEESVLVDKDVTIVGGGGDPSSVVVRIPEDGPRGDFNSLSLGYGFWFEDATAEIANLTIEGPGATVSALVAMGGELDAHGLVEDLDPYQFYPYGFLYIGNDATGVIHGNTSKAFVWIDDEATPVLRENTIHNVIRSDGNSAPHIVNNDLGGVWSRGSAMPVIESNVIDFANNGGADGGFSTCGIEVTSADTRPTIVGNTVSNATTGICIHQATPDEVSDNELIDNAVGVGLYSTDATVKDGSITGEGSGIIASGGGTPSIVNNDIEVAGRGISIGNGNSAKVHSNTVCGAEASIHLSEAATPELGDNETCGE